MGNKGLVKYRGGLIKHVGNAISVTNKLLALSEAELIPYRKGDKWGFCTPDKRMVIECLYENVGFFSEGLAAVKQNKKWGYINIKGEVKIPCIYEMAYGFYCGAASVYINKGGTPYYIDKDRKLLFTHTQKLLINRENIKNSKEVRRICRNEKWGFAIGENIIIECKYDEANQFGDGLASVRINGKWGFIDKNDKVFIPFMYSGAGYFRDGLANVCKRGKHGFIDKNNNTIIPFIYEDAHSFREDLASVKYKGKFGFIDKKGAIILEFIYDFASTFSRKLVNVDLNNKRGYINKYGVQYWED